MYNTTGDVALTNISRETNYFRDFVLRPNVLRLSSALGMLACSYCSPRSYKNDSQV